jgi:hypothetical protein
MHFPLIASARTPLALSALLAIAALPACGKGGQSGVIASCPPPAQPEGGIPNYQADGEFANGSISGTGLAAAICYAGVQVTTRSQSGPLLLTIDSTISSSAAVVSLPANAVDAQLQGSIEIASPKAGVYKSSDPSLCGSFAFTYGTPIVPSCGAPDAGGSCETGCQFTYTCGSGVGPCCVPLATTYVYQAGSGTTCAFLRPPSTEGAWTLTLTSVEAIPDASSQFSGPAYEAHGTLSATLKGTADTTNSATLSLSF